MPATHTRGKVEAVEPMTTEQRDKALASAYNEASQRLRDEHREDFNAYYAEAALARGVKWEPRMTREEKAEQQMRELLQEFPGLWERVSANHAGQDGSAGEVAPAG